MLKLIPPLISPELLLTLAEMGHGDDLVIADRNFPAESVAASTVTGRASACPTWTRPRPRAKS